ncbi:amino acid permease [Ammonifex thiophilus]|uniref:Amino acid permease n=1 Tax=Ammonifex thiophilus TaxID=444093 RepID=A0A3D8P1E8_9THEO|nr:amino acid permease [Ammonifex thiophilus]RDV81304.1 amino acid permease [Ammonifex thiophilus]
MRKVRRRGAAEKKLSLADLVALAWGGMIGTGIFLASGIPIHLAGPAAVLVYLYGGLLVTLVASMLAEMTAYHPHDGGYSFYVQEYLGPFWGFLVGWNYWVSGVFTLLTEVIAAALLTRWWLPSVPLWLLVLAYSLLVVGINLLGLKSLSLFEDWMAFVKAAALALFALWGFITLLRGFSGEVVLEWRTVFPQGWRGVLASFPVALFSYAALSVVSLAAPQAENPVRDVPRAVLLAGMGCTLLYSACLLVMVCLLPYQETPLNSSPLAAVLVKAGFSWAGNALNALILVAVLSVMLTSLYGVSNMLASLAERGEAPAFLAAVDSRGIPYRAVWLTVAFLALGIFLSYLLPRQVFGLVVSSASFLSFLNWVPTVIAYLAFRRQVPLARLPFRVPGFPYPAVLALLSLLAVIVAVPLVPSQLPAFCLGLGIALLLSLGYFLFH